jgi:phycoerythrin-associated linker protein
MVSTAVYPSIESMPLRLGTLRTTDAVQMYANASDGEVETVIRALYRQVLGNAHVMESERLTTLESQLKQGQLTVREFVRQLAKSELYRSRFFDSCYRYRAIEVNFKHLLGRAPSDFEEMRSHSAVLDTQGFDADIDSYLDSDEYQDAFGENTVPYYRGHQTQSGRSMQAFTNFCRLLPNASSSDKDLKTNNKAKLTNAILSRPAIQVGDARDILAKVFAQSLAQSSSTPDLSPSVAPSVATSPVAANVQDYGGDSALQLKVQAQARQIADLQQQLASLSASANVGSAISSGSWRSSDLSSGSATGFSSASEFTSLRQQAEAQAVEIAALQSKIADARRFDAIADYRLNKWRSRVFNG